ncbi:hypothetical protein [Streptomyces goshikiensis]|uniref:hypothetical protein n=1 Tax=Streptomyces goshikiensis TaxID=1942 RepID=UPI00365683BE
MNAAVLDYGSAAVGADGAARVAPHGAWHTVVSAHHPLIDDPDVHLVVAVEKGRLLIAVGPHSDAGLPEVLAVGPCATVARKALRRAGALPKGRKITVACVEGWNRNSIILTTDQALCVDGEDRGQLMLAFAPDMNPHLLQAFAPWAASLMCQSLDAPAASPTGPPDGIPSPLHPLPSPRREIPPAPAEPDDGLVAGGPGWQRFWFGPDSRNAPEPGAFDFTTALQQFRTRVITESGTARLLAEEHGLQWDDLPAAHKELLHVPGPASSGNGLDIAALMLRTRIEDWTWDGMYARVSPHRLTEDLTDLHPTDVSALRWGLVAPKMFTTDRKLSSKGHVSHGLAALTTTAAYLAVPHTHFVPADLALDVATTSALGKSMLAELRLPGPWAMVLHEPVPLAAIHADDEKLQILLDEDQTPGDGHAVLGAVLSAHPDQTLDTNLGLVLVTSVHPERGRQWYLQPASFGTDHGAGRLLYSYAAQLAFATWRKPPAPPVQERGKPGSANALKRLAKDPAARAGALHRMSVLDFTPPPTTFNPHDASAGGAGGSRKYGTWRRAHWAPNRRIGLRDENDQLIGPVYKENAIEGVTFTRGPVFIPRSRVRADLPLRPDRRVVYRLRDSESAD